MSHSSAGVTYRPAGAGHRARTARVDLTRVPDPEAWLTNRLGSLASFVLTGCSCDASGAIDPSDAVRLDAIASHLTATMQAVLAARHEAFGVLSARLEPAKPVVLRRSVHPEPTEETDA